MIGMLSSILFLLTFVCYSHQDTEVKLTVFYEPLGLDSIKFITQQFFPTYKGIGKPLKVVLVPFNKAWGNNVTVKWDSTCQQEPKECYINAIQACVINMYSPEASSHFVSCSMSAEDPSADQELMECSRLAELTWTDIQKCYKYGQAEKLITQNIKRARKEEPKEKDLPTILVNDKFDHRMQDEAVFNFKRLICELMINEPEYCHDEGNEFI